MNLDYILSLSPILQFIGGLLFFYLYITIFHFIFVFYWSYNDFDIKTTWRRWVHRFTFFCSAFAGLFLCYVLFTVMLPKDNSQRIYKMEFKLGILTTQFLAKNPFIKDLRDVQTYDFISIGGNVFEKIDSTFYLSTQDKIYIFNKVDTATASSTGGVIVKGVISSHWQSTSEVERMINEWLNSFNDPSIKGKFLKYLTSVPKLKAQETAGEDAEFLWNGANVKIILKVICDKICTQNELRWYLEIVFYDAELERRMTEVEWKIRKDCAKRGIFINKISEYPKPSYAKDITDLNADLCVN